jgi:hypothetical protein
MFSWNLSWKESSFWNCDGAASGNLRRSASDDATPLLVWSVNDVRFQGGKADIERCGGCYPPRGQRCLSVGDQRGYLFTTVRFAYAPNRAYLQGAAGTNEI